jgi:hypothetical protein
MPCEKRLIENDYDSTIGIKKPRIYVYVGDDFGYLKCLDITYIIKKSGVRTKTTKWKDRPNANFTPNRCEGIDITPFVAESLRKSVYRRTTVPNVINMINSRM